MTLFSSPIVLVLVGVIGLLIGLLVGFLFLDRDARKSRTADIPEELSKDGFMEIARMLYSPTRKRIVTALDGEFYKEAKELNTDQHTRLTKVLRIWSDWNNASGVTAEESEPAGMEALETPQPAAVEDTAAAATAATPPEDTSAETSAIETEEAVFSTAFTAPVEAGAPVPFVEETEAPEIPVEPITEEPVEELAPMEAPAAEVKNQTIVEQINQTLQAMLPGTPYEYRGLTLEDDSQNGVLVFAGSEKFYGIDAVPYADAQELIRSAVTEWERKYESEQNKPA